MKLFLLEYTLSINTVHYMSKEYSILLTQLHYFWVAFEAVTEA